MASSIVSQLRSEKYIGDVEYQFSKLDAYFDTKDKAAKNYTEVDYAPTTISEVVYKTLENIKSLFSISKYADCAADFVYFEAIFRRNTVCISRKINEEIRKICKQDAC